MKFLKFQLKFIKNEISMCKMSDQGKKIQESKNWGSFVQEHKWKFFHIF
jgi:hypothetical protein